MTMKNLLLILALIICSSELHAQVLIGKIYNENGIPLAYSTVVDIQNQKQTKSSFDGSFGLRVNEMSKLKIIHPNYKVEKFDIDWTLLKDDTIRQTFNLKTKIQLVEEVVASGKKIQDVADIYNHNIVDYIPFDHFTLCIKTFKKKRFLSVEGMDTTYLEKDFSDQKIDKLFRDCMGNIHMLSEDSAFQIYLNSEIHIVSKSNINEFKRILEPCVADMDEHLVFKSSMYHNKLFLLNSLQKVSGEKKAIFYEFDTLGFYWARKAYGQMLAEYHRRTFVNQIALGVWDGDFESLNYMGGSYIWYKYVRADELEIQTFKDSSSMIILDQEFGNIYFFNEQMQRFAHYPFPFAQGSTIYPVLQDRKTLTYYDLSYPKGTPTLVSVNQAFNKQFNPRTLILSDASRAENIKVHDNWAYFLLEENGFFGLHRAYIPELVD